MGMGQSEEQAAWRLYCYNWVLVGLMAAALVVGMVIAGFSVAPLSAAQPLAVAGVYIGYAHYKVWRVPKYDPKVIFILGSTGQILLIPALMAPLTYVAASANLPMQDAALDALDRALGLDWMAWFNFVYERPALLFATVLAYSMIGWPVFGVPIALGWTRRYRRLQQFILAFGIALVVTTIISIFVPAMGTYDFLHFMPDPEVYTPGSYLGQVRDLPMVRDGTLRHLSFDSLTGIVTLPSFRAAASILYLWAFWPVRWIGPGALVPNIAMLLSTPIGGGHYFVDIFAGIAVAAASILAARLIAERLTRAASPARDHTKTVAIPAE